MLQLFIRCNTRWSDWVEQRLPTAFVTQLKGIHQELAEHAANKVGVTLDVGAGFMSPFARKRHHGTIIGIDISAEQIARNCDIDVGVVASAYRLPIRTGIADVVVTHTLIEHLIDTDAFMREVTRVLRPGGTALHLFPGKFAPFAILNRTLPERLKRRLLQLTRPESDGLLGFPAFYNLCTEPAMRRRLRDLGFDIIETRCYYYQSLYFKAVFPLYLMSLAYDIILWRLDIKVLASQILIVAKYHL